MKSMIQIFRLLNLLSLLPGPEKKPKETPTKPLVDHLDAAIPPRNPDKWERSYLVDKADKWEEGRTYKKGEFVDYYGRYYIKIN